MTKQQPGEVFDDLEGVVETRVGYTGGANPKPSYSSVCAGVSIYHPGWGPSPRDLMVYSCRWFDVFFHLGFVEGLKVMFYFLSR